MSGGDKTSIIYGGGGDDAHGSAWRQAAEFEAGRARYCMGRVVGGGLTEKGVERLTRDAAHHAQWAAHWANAYLLYSAGRRVDSGGYAVIAVGRFRFRDAEFERLLGRWFAPRLVLRALQGRFGRRETRAARQPAARVTAAA